jgi:hypothetical protein
MNKIKAIINNQWFFPILFFYYGLGYLFLGETYYLNDGRSMDGIVFSSFVSNPTASYFFDAYYVHRILPSVIVGTFLKLLSIKMTSINICTAFQVLNIFCIMLSCLFIKKILVLFKVSFRNQLLAFVLFLLNFSILKIPLYLPVMTDTPAVLLSIMMLFFYVKKSTFGVAVCTILACFTWPSLFYQGIILVVIPFATIPYSAFKPSVKLMLQLGSALVGLAICFYIIFIEKEDTKVEFVAKINRTFLPLSIAGVTLFFFFFAKIGLNANLLNTNLFFQKLKLKNILYLVAVIATTAVVIWYLNPPPNKFYLVENILRGTVSLALVWPLVTIVAHTAFWGMMMILLLFFWNDFSKFISQMGWGIVAALGLNLFSFGISSETRCLMNMLPWIIVFLVKAINKYSFSKTFYIVVAVFSLFASKIWLVLNPNKSQFYYMNLDKNGSMGFPDQKLWMHIGPWMDQEMYYWQGAGILILMIILFFILYRFELGGKKKLRLIARYR